MKRIKLWITTLALCVGFGAAVPAATFAATTPEQTVCTTLQSNDNCTKTPDDSLDLNRVIKAIINILSIVIGVVAVIMIMVSGFKYITAGGDSSKITSAKNTIIYAVIGLIVAALAQAIVKTVLNKLKDV